jgi:hypothetical protein
MSKLNIFIVAVFTWLMICGVSQADRLVWNENTETDLKGYNVYYEGFDSSDVIDVGLINELDLDFLEEGVEYVLNVTAYDTSLNESEFSEDLIYTKPTTTTTSIATTSTTSSIPTTTTTSIATTSTTTSIVVISTTIPTTTTTSIVEEWMPCEADINGDGVVDEVDEDILYEELGIEKCRKRGRKKCRADLNGDRRVDELDEEILMNEFGREDCNDVPLLLYMIQEALINHQEKVKERRRKLKEKLYGND